MKPIYNNEMKTSLSAVDFSRRDVGIDLMRAIVMFTMIFVNDLWSVHDVPHWMLHAKAGEDFMGLSDVVFPSFLFVVGMSIPFAIERRYTKGLSVESTLSHIFSRAIALIVMGVVLVNSEGGLASGLPYNSNFYKVAAVLAFIAIWNQYPKTDNSVRRHIFTALKIIGILLLLYLAATFRNPSGGVLSSQWWGILGLIGWTYLLCALVYVFVRRRLSVLITVWVVCVLCSMVSSVLKAPWGDTPLFDFPNPNIFQQILSGVLHIGNGTLPAFTMGGIIFSLICQRYSRSPLLHRLVGASVAIVLLSLLGMLSHRFWIVSKLSETPPWIFYVSAIAIALYTLLTVLIEKGMAGWLNVIKPAGTATLTCYLVPYLLYALFITIGLVVPEWASSGILGLLKCVAFSFLTIGVTWLFERAHIKLKI
ncbi:MAG: DUF5009 domain-containing protein [Prevotellaceae bacterium]|jgi:predicted acyltransferase|nr:DUF5009 domain-containing protein [Prevotellaceae bacterium]